MEAPIDIADISGPPPPIHAPHRRQPTDTNNASPLFSNLGCHLCRLTRTCGGASRCGCARGNAGAPPTEIWRRHMQCGCLLMSPRRRAKCANRRRPFWHCGPRQKSLVDCSCHRIVVPLQIGPQNCAESWIPRNWRGSAEMGQNSPKSPPK